MLGYCGRDCEDCESFHAAANESDRCTGCRSEGSTANILGGDCEIRLCAQRNRQPICATCSSFPCSKLDKIFTQNPAAKEHLYKLLAE